MSPKSSKRTLTIQIDEALLKYARHIAVDKDQSLSTWVANLIADAVKRSRSLAASKRRALAVLKSPLRLSGNIIARDDIRER